MSGTTIPADYFANKTVTVVVNFSPGGPTDTFARLFAQALPKYMPGRPTMVVQNMAGGGGHIGNLHLYNVAKPDGLTMGITTPTVIDQVVAPERITDDISKFQWLGGVLETQVDYVHSDLGIKSPEELPRAKVEIVVGGLGADGAKDLGMRLFLNSLGVKYKYVTGYPGNNDVRAAIQRKEVNFFEESLTGYMTGVLPMVQAGEVVAIAQRGLFVNDQVVRDSHVPNIPTMTEAVLAVKGPDGTKSLDYRGLMVINKSIALSRAIIYPPTVDPALVDVMRKAVSEAYLDPDFLAQATKQLGYDFSGVAGAEAQKMVAEVVQQSGQDQEVVAYIKKLSQEKP